MGVGPHGVTFFDPAYMVMRYTYHFEDIAKYDFEGSTLTLKCEDGIESRYETEEAEEIFNLIDQYVSEQMYANECEHKAIAAKQAAEQKITDKENGIDDDDEDE